MNILERDYTKSDVDIQGLPVNLKVKGFFVYKQNRIIVVKCNICAKDSELFKDGLFFSYKGNLVKGNLPCGCARSPQWEYWQWKILVERALEKSPVKLIEFLKERKGCYTKALTYCNKHGTHQKSTTIRDILKGHAGCITCSKERVGEHNRRDYDHYLTNGVSSGSFLKGTEILKIVISSRNKSEIAYSCPVCSEDEYTEAGVCNGVFITNSDKIMKGIKSCRCSVKFNWKEPQRVYQILKRIDKEDLPYHSVSFKGGYRDSRSKFEYICELHGEQLVDCHGFLKTKVKCPSCSIYGYDKNLPANLYCVVWSSGNQSFVKVGITNNPSEQRIHKQNRETSFNPMVIKSYYHESGDFISNLEKEIKQTFKSGVISKELFPDGYTETFNLSDYKEIVSLINTRMEL